MSNQYEHIMVDLETLDTKTTSVILSIGAVKFNGDEIVECFYEILDIQDQIEARRTISGDTLSWWVKQSEAANLIFNYSDKLDLFTALMNFSEFFDHKDYKVWGNGATFDNAILIDAYHQCQLQHPWSYKNDRCFRTVLAEFERQHPTALPVRVNYGDQHNALDDAKAQAMTLQNIWKATL